MTHIEPVGVGIVGCGTISHAYLENLTTFPDLRVIGCADLDVPRAKQVAERYGVPVAGETEEIIGHPEVELVVNLTIPVAHVEVDRQAIAAGRHVYSEKPLALDRTAGARLLADAATAGVRVGCAPDTFLGAGLQTTYRLIAEGAIGVPQSVLSLLRGAGPESWHPNPEFYFQPGGGPLFDMGPYFLTALVGALGPARQVASVARRARQRRTVGSGPKAGTEFPVLVDTHVTTLVDFTAGPAASMMFSFDSPLSRPSLLEITGTEATLEVPDPNTFDGEIRLRRPGSKEWVSVPATGRGMGVLDMARAIRTGQPHRASGELGQHVVDLMVSMAESAVSSAFVPVRSDCPIPEPLPVDWDPHRRTGT